MLKTYTQMSLIYLYIYITSWAHTVLINIEYLFRRHFNHYTLLVFCIASSSTTIFNIVYLIEVSHVDTKPCVYWCKHYKPTSCAVLRAYIHSMKHYAVICVKTPVECYVILSHNTSVELCNAVACVFTIQERSGSDKPFRIRFWTF